jgi:hypothetical protein
MRRNLLLALCLASLALTACNGPKETCQGSFESYWSYLKSHDWEGAYEMLTPQYKNKITLDRYIAGMEEEWAGSKNFSMTVSNLSESAAGCFVNGGISYNVKIRGQQPYRVDGEYFSWIFRKQKDGKWYIELPGMEKVGAF